MKNFHYRPRKYFHVYIMANHYNTTIYIGVTGNLKGRIGLHKSGQYPGFTQKYNLKKLVYLEEFTYARDAIMREKKLKKWTRSKKDKLINSINPNWEDIQL